jgi:hypothetical protein
MNSKKVLNDSSIGRFLRLISQDMASLLLGSRLCSCSSTFSIAANLFDQN